MTETAKSSRVEDAYAKLKEDLRTSRIVPGFQATEPDFAVEKEELYTWAEADDRVHLAQLDPQGNGRLKSFIAGLYGQAHRARMVTLCLRELPRKSTAEHREIVQHPGRGDAETTRRVFREHQVRTTEKLLAILEKYRIE